MQEPRHNTRSGAPVSPLQSWINLAAPFLPVLACFLGGATRKTTEGIVVAMLGLLLLLQPPRLSLGRALNSIIVLLVLCAAFSFFPARWIAVPEWRVALQNDFGIKLGSAITPQPWLTLGCFISFIAGLSWLYFMCTQRLELRAARLQMRLFAAGIVFLALVSIALHFAHVTPPFWQNERNFGPFANRNQTGNLFGLTAIVVLACGQDDLRHGRKRWIGWLIALSILFVSVILNFSRAGVLIFLLGIALWIGCFALRKGAAAPLALGFSILLLLLTAMLVFGGETLERFHLHAAAGPSTLNDFRLLIYQDVWHMIRASAWCGLGLGNFECVFAIFRDASIARNRALHPESDWLWLWSELGWPAVLLCIAGLTLLLRGVWPLREGTNQRIRLAALIAAILFALHGLVDVSGHRVGTAYSAIFLLGLALHRPLDFSPSKIAPPLFRLLGLALLICGCAWTISARNKLPLPGAVGADNAKRLAIIANRGRNFADTISLTTRALDWAPLDWQLYYLRALGKVQARQPTESTLEDFRRARFLEPNALDIPFEEGNVWLNSHATLALTAWREALRRAGPQRAAVYQNMLAISAKRAPEVNRMLEELGAGQAELAVTFLESVDGARFKSALNRLLERDPNLQTLSAAQKTKLFSLWSQRGDLDLLARAADAHPDWQQFAWEGLAKFAAGKKDFHRAYEIAHRFGGTPALPQTPGDASLDQLWRNFQAAPDNYAVGYALFQAQMRAGKIENALQTARHFSEQRGAPAYFRFLEAETWAAKEDWERAWNAWSAYHDAAQK